MPRLRLTLALCASCSLLVIAGFCPLYSADDITAESLVARHLDSIGAPAVRAAVNTRVIQGKLKFQVLIGGGGATGGTWGRVSQQQKSNFVMRFGLGDWRGEQFVSDAERAYVAAKTASLKRSVFGDFVHSQDYILKEGLLGGVLSTSWALENLDANKPRLTYGGLKKIGDQQFYDLAYRSSHRNDMQIHLYFDPVTYHHVKTVYTIELAPNMGPTITSSAFQKEIRYRIEERFGEFKTINGASLPTAYALEYTEELQNGRTRVYLWDMTVDQSDENVGLDPKNFEMR